MQFIINSQAATMVSKLVSSVNVLYTVLSLICITSLVVDYMYFRFRNVPHFGYVSNLIFFIYFMFCVFSKNIIYKLKHILYCTRQQKRFESTIYIIVSFLLYLHFCVRAIYKQIYLHFPSSIAKKLPHFVVICNLLENIIIYERRHLPTKSVSNL